MSYSLSLPGCDFPPTSALPKTLTGTKVTRDPTREDGGLPMTKMDVLSQSLLDKLAAIKAEHEKRRPRTAAERIAARDEAAQQQSASERYQAALNFGKDYASFISNNLKELDEYGRISCSNELITARYDGHTSTYVSAQGTIIGIDRVGNKDQGDYKNPNNTIQITRKDGFQLNLEVTDDLRINDLEDGSLSIYYASSGISRIFDAEGNETIVEGEKNVLSTSGDDIILNTFSKRIDAGDGDDTIISFAADAELLGGNGNDNILLHSSVASGKIDGGSGDDAIFGYSIHDANITMEEGKDSLTLIGLHRTNITSSGDDRIKVLSMSQSKMTSRNGILEMDMGGILDSALTIDRAKEFSLAGILGSNLVFGNGNVIMHAANISNSSITTGSGNDMITSTDIYKSTINTGDGNDVIKNTNKTSYSSINMGNGNDAFTGMMGNYYYSNFFGIEDKNINNPFILR